MSILVIVVCLKMRVINFMIVLVVFEFGVFSNFFYFLKLLFNFYGGEYNDV